MRETVMWIYRPCMHELNERMRNNDNQEISTRWLKLQYETR